jgi:hypothetical protein
LIFILFFIVIFILYMKKTTEDGNGEDFFFFLNSLITILLLLSLFVFFGVPDLTFKFFWQLQSPATTPDDPPLSPHRRREQDPSPTHTTINSNSNPNPNPTKVKAKKKKRTEHIQDIMSPNASPESLPTSPIFPDLTSQLEPGPDSPTLPSDSEPATVDSVPQQSTTKSGMMPRAATVPILKQPLLQLQPQQQPQQQQQQHAQRNANVSQSPVTKTNVQPTVIPPNTFETAAVNPTTPAATQTTSSPSSAPSALPASSAISRANSAPATALYPNPISSVVALPITPVAPAAEPSSSGIAIASSSATNSQNRRPVIKSSLRPVQKSSTPQVVDFTGLSTAGSDANVLAALISPVKSVPIDIDTNLAPESTRRQSSLTVSLREYDLTHPNNNNIDSSYVASSPILPSSLGTISPPPADVSSTSLPTIEASPVTGPVFAARTTNAATLQAARGGKSMHSYRAKFYQQLDVATATNSAPMDMSSQIPNYSKVEKVVPAKDRTESLVSDEWIAATPPSPTQYRLANSFHSSTAMTPDTTTSGTIDANNMSSRSNRYSSPERTADVYASKPHSNSSTSNATSRGDDDDAESFVPSSSHVQSNANVKIDALLKLHYTVHTKPPLNFSDFICAGCGVVVTMTKKDKREKMALFCQYTGRFFCDRCHSNDLRVLPGAVLQRWDFKPKPVCKLAKSFLDDIHEKPCIDMANVSPKVREAHTTPDKLTTLRAQLDLQIPFLLTCRETQRQHLMSLANPYLFLLMSDPLKFSMETIIKAVKGDFLSFLKKLVDQYTEHITKECQLCMGKGSFCEADRERKCVVEDHEPLYPFLQKQCIMCPTCKCLYHKKCAPKVCFKCQRQNLD